MMPSRAAVERAAEVLRGHAGFRHDRSLEGRLVRGLRDEAVAAGVSVDDVLVELDRDASALQRLVDRVTVQESSFFRDPAQFEALAEIVLPTLSGATVWSAACANGQEPWSLAMVLDEEGRGDCRVLATDISAAALARAERGWYSERELRGLDERRRRRFFRPADGGWEIAPALRDLVRFAPHNLVDADPPLGRGGCDLAFCRNVLIYLTDEQITAVLERMAWTLRPGGYLFLGYSETPWRVPDPFTLRRLDEAFGYQTAPRAPVVVAPEPLPPAPPPEPAIDLAEPEPPAVDDLLAAGTAALKGGRTEDAVVAFRKAVYLCPGDATAALHLAFALDTVGDRVAARPWFRRAYDAVQDADGATVLEGWSAEELVRFLDRRLDLQEEKA